VRWLWSYRANAAGPAENPACKDRPTEAANPDTAGVTVRGIDELSLFSPSLGFSKIPCFTRRAERIWESISIIPGCLATRVRPLACPVAGAGRLKNHELTLTIPSCKGAFQTILEVRCKTFWLLSTSHY